MKSGFATLVGRPNVGKSTLLNTILGQKVSITSTVVQTTRNQVRGVLNRPGVQVVFVDTPGVHKPRTLLGRRLNDTAADALEGVDLTLFVVDATSPVGRGDRFVAAMLPRRSICVVNKVDAVPRAGVLEELKAVSQIVDADEFFPVSAKTGEGVDALVEAIVERMPEGPQMYPDDMVTDVPEAFWVAELVREQLLAVMRDEVPHSIACRVTEWEWPRIRCEILVERQSQKAIVIGRGGLVLKEVGQRVRAQLPEGAYLELFVKVDRDWQSRPKALERLGY
ncbi:MAG TPA: GTPase Era [Acidimicrobiales bacterium]|nr:GTPase Era [Acidimicrobiales bacterium]